MTDRDALLAAICAHPGEDDPRLRYADWLDENLSEAQQPERAEFIRVQCRGEEWADRRHAAARWFMDGPLGTVMEWTNGYDRRTRAIKTYSRREHPYRDHGFELVVFAGHNQQERDGQRIPNNGFILSRGFVSALTCTAADWLAYADALCWHPAQMDACPDCVLAAIVPLASRLAELDALPISEWVRQTYRAGSIQLTWWEYREQLLRGIDELRSSGRGSPNLRPDCIRCSSTGRVPRPVPSTAQPITRVVWTDYSTADVRELAERYRRTRREADRSAHLWPGISRVAADLWPGISFSIPERSAQPRFS